MVYAPFTSCPWLGVGCLVCCEAVKATRVTARAVLAFRGKTCAQVLPSFNTVALERLVANRAAVAVDAVQATVSCTDVADPGSATSGRLLQTTTQAQLQVSACGSLTFSTMSRKSHAALDLPLQVDVLVDIGSGDPTGLTSGGGVLQEVIDTSVTGGLSFTITSSTAQLTATEGG